jgi:hypothetical protein
MLGEATAAIAGQGERTEWAAVSDAFISALEQLRDTLAQAAQELASADTGDPGLRTAGRRAGRLAESLAAILDADGDSGLRWVEATRGGFSVAFTPFEVAARFGELMRAQGGAWIFTSATPAVGDDFLVSDAALVRQAAAAGAANTVLLKPNQRGTLTETLEAWRTAQSLGYAGIVSARSGETEDTTIVHLAVGWGTGQLKVGSFARGERMAKWNEALRVEEGLGARARFAGANAFGRSRA